MKDYSTNYMKKSIERCPQCAKSLTNMSFSVDPQDKKTIINSSYSCVCGATVVLKGEISVSP